MEEDRPVEGARAPAGSRFISLVKLGEAQTHGRLSVFPLRADTKGGPWYVTLREAAESGQCLVGEVSQGASVPDLRVENKGDTRVLILDGEELRGAKQNRVLSTTILVGMRSSLVVPVSCTEHGRWSYETPAFAPTEYVAERQVRMRLKETVDSSVRAGCGHRSDQG